MAGDKKRVVGVDLGGTRTRAALLAPGGRILVEVNDKTPVTGREDDVLEALFELIDEVCERGRIKPKDLEGIGIGVPGTLDVKAGKVLAAANLGFRDTPLRHRVEKALEAKAYIENDANCGLLGEHRSGAARGLDDVLGIWVGTGIGGALILDGRLYRGSRGAAGELGHAVLVPGGPACGCGNRGCLETLASRSAIERDIRLGLARGEKSALKRLAARGERFPAGALGKALKAKDPLTMAVMEEAQRYMGLALAGWLNVLDPSCVVFGGGLPEKLGEDYLQPIRAEAARHTLKAAGRPARIVAAELGDRSGVLGAAGLVPGFK